MKKEEIYVGIDSEEKRLLALQILKDACENIYKDSSLLKAVQVCYTILHYSLSRNEWILLSSKPLHKTEITLDQLEQLLNPNYAVKGVILSVDELKRQAEKLGFELTEKKREVKIGDFCKFWDDDEEHWHLGFISKINKDSTYKFIIKQGTGWMNAAHLTEEEKEKIIKSW